MSHLVETLPRAVCCLILNAKCEILAISRMHEDLWGLPGGKVDPGESLEVAVVREVFEETGLVIANPIPVFTGVVKGDITFLCTTFIAKVVAKVPDAPRSRPFAGEVCWKSPDVLARGPFKWYSRALFTALNVPFHYNLEPGHNYY